MKQYLKVTGVIAIVLAVFVGLWAVDNFYYPFKSESPNYSDVERAFAKLQFPADWKEISSSENRGLFGRGCDPLNDSGCFHKGKSFKVPEGFTSEGLKNVIIQSGLCSAVVENDITQSGESKPSFNMNCGTDNSINVGADLIGTNSEVYVSVKTY